MRLSGVALVAFFVAANVLLVLGYAGVWPSPPAGLTENLAIYVGLAWLVTVAVKVARNRSSASALPALGQPSRPTVPR